MALQFAVTVDDTEVSRRIDYSVTKASLSKDFFFDPSADLSAVVSAAVAKLPEADDMQYAAAQAIQRLKSRSEQTTEAWAEDLSRSFFTDLESSDR